MFSIIFLIYIGNILISWFFNVALADTYYELNNPVYGLQRYIPSDQGLNMNRMKVDEYFISMGELRRINSCFIPPIQHYTWYASIVYFKRYKLIYRIYKQCSIARIKVICREFQNFLKCPIDPTNSEVQIIPHGKEASTVFAVVDDSNSDRNNKLNFELFKGCVYEIGNRSALRVRCLRSNKIKTFPTKVVIKVDGRTSDFLYHFNHELIVYSRLSSSTYGSEQLRLHPSIYSLFLTPKRTPIAKDILMMEYITGPSLLSILSKLNSYPDVLQYLKVQIEHLVNQIIEKYQVSIISNGSSTEFAGNSDQSSIKLNIFQALQDAINKFIFEYVENTLLFTIQIYKKLLYLSDIFHRGGTSFYPINVKGKERGSWKRQRSIRLHCDFHAGNILVKLPSEFFCENGNQYNLTQSDMLNIKLYDNLKIIDLEDAVEIRESDLPISLDKFIGIRPCPVYITDADTFLGRLLSNMVSIVNVLDRSIKSLNKLFQVKNVTKYDSRNNYVSSWVKGELGNLEKTFFIHDSIFKVIDASLASWSRFVRMVTDDEITRPCTIYYHFKYGSNQITSTPLPCSWLSNILMPKIACKYLDKSFFLEGEISQLNSNAFPNSGLSEDQVEYIKRMYKSSLETKCHIDDKEAMNITIESISEPKQQFVDSIKTLNSTNWGEWSKLIEVAQKEENILKKENKLEKNNKQFIFTSSIFDSNPTFSKAEMQLSNYNSFENLYLTKLNVNIPVEFDAALIELMGLAAMQRIIRLCIHLKDFLECRRVSPSSITRNGPIASFIVKLTQLKLGKSDKKKDMNLIGSCFINNVSMPLIGSNITLSGWICPQSPTISSSRYLRLVVDGRLFLDVNSTIYNENKVSKFVFNDILGYMHLKDNITMTAEHNEAVIQLLQQHKQNALKFWRAESLLRNFPNGSQQENDTKLLSKLLIFIPSTNPSNFNIDLSSLNKQSNRSEVYTHFPLPKVQYHFSSKISSIVQLGSITDYAFFCENASRNSVASVLKSVSNFSSNLDALMWISYSTLILAIVEKLIKYHSFQMLIAYNVFRLIEKFREYRYPDILLRHSEDKFAKRNLGVSIDVSYSERRPVICELSLKKLMLKANIGFEWLDDLALLQSLSLKDLEGICFADKNDMKNRPCIGKIGDVEVILRDILFPSLDPVATLVKAIEETSTLNSHLPVELRRSRWLIHNVILQLVNFINRKREEKVMKHKIPILISSLMDILSLKDKLLSNNTFIRCYQNSIDESEEKEICLYKDYETITSEAILNLKEMFKEQHLKYKQLSALDITQEFLQYFEEEFQNIAPPLTSPPDGGLGWEPNVIDDKLYQVGLGRNSSLNVETMAFILHWPIIADIWHYIE
ncbi:hypothetical protein ACR3K2_01560 [Cryptosporidium serpentis]